MDIAAKLPEEAAVLSKREQLWYWITLNRVQLGVLALAIIAAASASIGEKHVAAHRWMHVAELLTVLLTGATAGGAVGGALFKSNAYHEREMNAKIRGASGGFDVPVYADRRSDVQPPQS